MVQVSQMLGASVASDLSLENLAEYEDEDFKGSSGWIWVDTANAEIAQNLTAIGLQPWFLAPSATRYACPFTRAQPYFIQSRPNGWAPCRYKSGSHVAEWLGSC